MGTIHKTTGGRAFALPPVSLPRTGVELIEYETALARLLMLVRL